MAKTSKTKPAKRERVRLVTPPFVLSFPSLWTPRKPDEGEGKPKFLATAIWTPGKMTDGEKGLYRALLAELDKEARAVFGTAWKELPDNVKRGLRDGRAKADVAGYGEGTRFANMSSLNRPGVVDKRKNPIGPEHGNEEEIYPGCICRATVNVWSYNDKYKGVGIGLLNLQKLADGDRLDNRVKAEDDFDDDIDSRFLDDDDDGDFGDDGDGDDDGDDF